MSKVITISLAQAGGDISTVDIYHTAIDSGSLLASNVSASLLTGSGIQYTVDDAVDTFFAVVNDGGECNLTSGSFSGSFFTTFCKILIRRSSRNIRSYCINYFTSNSWPHYRFYRI